MQPRWYLKVSLFFCIYYLHSRFCLLPSGMMRTIHHLESRNSVDDYMQLCILKYDHGEKWYGISTDSFQNMICLVICPSLEAWKRLAHIYRDAGKGLREQPNSRHIHVLT